MCLWAAYQLRLVIKSIKSGAPFDQQNPKRLRWIGWIVLAMGPFWGIFSYWQGTTMIEKLSLPGAKISLDADMHLSIILLGIMILVIAQIFDIAVKLQQDQELTI